MFSRFRTQLNLPNLTPLVRLPGVAFSLGLLVKELAVIQHPADRGLSIRGHFNQIEPLLPGSPKRLVKGHNARLLSLSINQPHPRCPDLLIHAMCFRTDLALLDLPLLGGTRTPGPFRLQAGIISYHICGQMSNARQVFA
jgi:hypothetical protein